MNEDNASLMGMFSPLSLGNDIGTVDSSFNFTASPVISSTGGAPVTSAAQANPTAGISGFQTVLNGLTSMFSTGIAAYNTVASKTGLPLADGTKTAPAVASAPVEQKFAGLTMNQLLLIGGGVLVVGVLIFLKRR